MQNMLEKKDNEFYESKVEINIFLIFDGWNVENIKSKTDSFLCHMNPFVFF